jgi:hypothetical protein
MTLNRTRRSSRRSPGVGSYLEPFALRALAAARGDDTLRTKAAQLFRSDGLHGHQDSGNTDTDQASRG